MLVIFVFSCHWGPTGYELVWNFPKKICGEI